MSRFDEEPDGDPHGECAAEIRRLQAEVKRLTAALYENESGALGRRTYEELSYKLQNERDAEAKEVERLTAENAELRKTDALWKAVGMLFIGGCDGLETLMHKLAKQLHADEAMKGTS